MFRRSKWALTTRWRQHAPSFCRSGCPAPRWPRSHSGPQRGSFGTSLAEGEVRALTVAIRKLPGSQHVRSAGLQRHRNRGHDDPSEPRSLLEDLRRRAHQVQPRNPLLQRAQTATAPHPPTQHPASHRPKKNSTSAPSTPPSAFTSAAAAPASQSVKNASTSPPSMPPSWL